MSDTWNDCTQSYENETGSSSTITNISNNDLLAVPLTNDPSSLIKLVNINGVNHLYIIQSNTQGEIRFITANAKDNNNQNGLLLYNTKIGEDGKLYFYHSYTIFNLGKLSGWYDVGNNISNIEIQLAVQDALIATLGVGIGSVAGDVLALQNATALTSAVVQGLVLGVDNLTKRVVILEIKGRKKIALEDLTESQINQIENDLFNVMYPETAVDAYNLVRQKSRMTLTTKLSLLLYKALTDALTGLAIVGFGTAVFAGIRQILDRDKAEEYKNELVSITDTLKKREVSITNDTLNHTGITITSGNTGYTAPNTKYRITIQREAVLLININATPIASVELVERVGITDFTIGETITITKAQLGGGTGGNLVLTVASLGTLKTWTEYRSNYLQTKIEGIDTKNRRKSNVIGATDIDTTQFTTTNVSYTDATDDVAETITYKQLKSRLNLLPTGASDIDVYTSTGKIGIGTAPTTTLHTYHTTNNILRLETGTSGTNSIEFRRGTAIDIFTDYRLISDAGVFKLQYENDLLAYGASGTELINSTATLTSIYKNTSFSGNVGINIAPHTTYKLDVNGDINISTGSLFKVNGSAYKPAEATLADTASDLAVGSILGIGKGGTGTTSHTAGNVLLGNGSGALTSANGLNYVSGTTTLNAPNVNLPTGGKYKINGNDLSYNNLTDKLVAGTNISIDGATNTISASGGGATYTAGDGIAISGANAISLSGTFNNFYMYPTLQTAILPADLVFTGTQPVVFSLPAPFNTLNKCVILEYNGVGTSTNYSFVVPTGGLIIDFLMVGAGGCGGKDMGAGGGGGSQMFGTNLFIPAGSYGANVGRGAQSSLNETVGRDVSCFNAGCKGGGSAPNVAYNGYSYSNSGGGGAGGTSVANGNNYSAVGGTGGIDSVFGGSYRGNNLTKCTLNAGVSGGTGVNARAGGTGQICSAGGGSGNSFGVNGASTVAIGTGTAPSNGGQGVLNDILGTTYRWGGGGGGGSTGYLNASTGGLGGGGGGQNADGGVATSFGAVGGSTYYTGGTGATALNGVNGTGGGGGGVGLGTTLAGNGGSGIVIIRYRRPKNAQIYIENAVGATPALRTFRTGMVDGNFKVQSVLASTGVATDVISVEEATGDLSIGSYTGGIAVASNGVSYFKNDITSAGIIVKNGSISCDNNFNLQGAYGYGNLRISGLISNNIENKAVWTINALSPTGTWMIKLASMPLSWQINIHNLVVWDTGNVSGLSSVYFGVWGFTAQFPYEGLLLSSTNKVNNAQTIAVSYGVVSSVGYFVITGIPIGTQVLWKLT